MHIVPNENGFNIRKYNGAQAAGDLLNKINNGTLPFNIQTDTLDVVAHSMGYAYSVGMVETLKLAGIKFGRFYALAPENACSGGVDWTLFTEAWQYGSNLDQPQKDKMFLQDGVAPQCECKLITGTYPNTKTGRVFIPASVNTKGYLGSHQIINYGWIFEKSKNQDGYVRPR